MGKLKSEKRMLILIFGFYFIKKLIKRNTRLLVNVIGTCGEMRMTMKKNPLEIAVWAVWVVWVVWVVWAKVKVMSLIAMRIVMMKVSLSLREQMVMLQMTLRKKPKFRLKKKKKICLI